jgi:Tol biopolymer transport system component
VTGRHDLDKETAPGPKATCRDRLGLRVALHRATLTALLCAAGLGAFAQAGTAAPQSLDWMGQQPPGESPTVFAPPAFEELGPWVETMDFSPDGNTCLVSVGSATYAISRLYVSYRRDGAWTAFAEAPFVASFYYSNEPAFLKDGKTVLFTGDATKGNKELWSVTYSAGSWGKPSPLPAPINSEYDEYHAFMAEDGSLYFGSERTGGMAVYRARRDPSGAYSVEMIGPPVSMGNLEGDPCVAPDGSYLVFYSCKDKRSANLYVSFADGAGGWSNPVGLGVNSPSDEYGARLSADGRYLFFTRHGPSGNQIFWVSSSMVLSRKR